MDGDMDEEIGTEMGMEMDIDGDMTRWRWRIRWMDEEMEDTRRWRRTQGAEGHKEMEVKVMEGDTGPWRRTPEDGPHHSQVSISADANFPVAPKWIRMNFPWGRSFSLRPCP